MSETASDSKRSASAGARWLRLLVLGVSIALACLGALALPDFVNAAVAALWVVLPGWMHLVLGSASWFVGLAVVAVPLTRRPSRIGPVTVPGVVWTTLDRATGWLMAGGLERVLAVTAAAMLACWVPHYLTWPWWTDTEYFAVLAQSWDAGILPYRDLYDFNFPGPTYVHWVLGKLFGWGRTVPFNLLDAAFLAGMGLLLAYWSRDRFGRAAPGVFGYVAFLGYYLGLNYSLVGQRDWHAAGLTAGALVLLEVRRDRVGLIGSALAYAAALAIRPQPVVFLPALLSALDEHARDGQGDWWKLVRAIALWSGVVALGLLVAAAPVLLAGVADDFLYWFRLAWYGGDYQQARPQGRLVAMLSQLGRWETPAVLLLLTGFAVAGPGPRRTARTWVLALAATLLYRPLSPFPHDYLKHPMMLVWSFGLAIVAARVLEWDRPVPAVRLLLLGLVLSFAVPRVPVFLRPVRSAQALADLARRDEPVLPPPGCEAALGLKKDRCPYHWEDYRAALAYLRRETGPRTLVANLFRSHPFPTVNAPTGRLTPFPSPAGLLWLRHAAPGLEEQFVEVLERPRDTVVVWSPSLPDSILALHIEEIERTVRANYAPVARFGRIEVWRRGAAAGPAREAAPGEQHGQSGE